MSIAEKVHYRMKHHTDWIIFSLDHFIYFQDKCSGIGLIQGSKSTRDKLNDLLLNTRTTHQKALRDLFNLFIVEKLKCQCHLCWNLQSTAAVLKSSSMLCSSLLFCNRTWTWLEYSAIMTAFTKAAQFWYFSCLCAHVFTTLIEFVKACYVQGAQVISLSNLDSPLLGVNSGVPVWWEVVSARRNPTMGD